ncbi:MAG TPA: hypothetical protein PKJ19_13165 [Flavobacteriales bacterium]|nr:hypothetical protein [Flavobacteriales bacterium]HNU57108.1 hypothetical protein [Flavobacteriales bacterium]
MKRHSDPLRHTLQGAINSRHAALRNGRSQRKDLDRVRAAIGRAEVFLSGYPYATDEQVRAYCRGNLEDITLIVPGSQPRVLARLVMDELETRANRTSAA